MVKMLQVILFVLYAVLVGIFGLAAWRLRWALRRFRVKTLMTSKKTIDDLPSVSVCMPARNENHVMDDALRSVIASTYPKLEIIVLDDLSGDNTSALIKAYAHEGVRFVEGTPLPDGWLGKNHALEALAHEASGTYVLYMDVDTRIAPDTIEELVAYAQQENAAMVSVLPRRQDGPRASVLFSSLRYFWEIMFHRAESPATASGAWMIDRTVLLQRLGGFDTYKDAVQPESKLSAALMATNEYRFLIGTELLGVTYEKKWRSQLMTSVRLLFPLLHSRLLSAVVATLDVLIIASPLLIVLSGFVVGWSFNQAIAGALWLMYAGLYAVYAKRVWNRGWLLGGLLWGFIALQEAVLIMASAVLYKQNKVTWKGRLVSAKK